MAYQNCWIKKINSLLLGDSYLIVESTKEPVFETAEGKSSVRKLGVIGKVIVSVSSNGQLLFFSSNRVI